MTEGVGTGDAPLLEREPERAAIARLLQGAGGAEPGVVLIEGPAGIGKSRLLDALRERARACGVQVLAAYGSDLEREFPFGVVRQLFDPPLALPAERDRLLAGAAAAARPVFEQAEPAGPGGDVSFAVLHGLYWLTVNLTGERPLLLAVDNLHWCDRPSLRSSPTSRAASRAWAGCSRSVCGRPSVAPTRCSSASSPTRPGRFTCTPVRSAMRA